jgi:hypothetical protein
LLRCRQFHKEEFGMTKQEERAARRAFWLQHLRECSMAGERLSSYARRHELRVGEGYHWTRVLKREGVWPLQPVGGTAAQSVIVKREPVPRFARVRIEPPRASELFLPLKVQLLLANGRRAEVLLSDERQLLRVLSLLEQPG